jgi:hypothetical protein
MGCVGGSTASEPRPARALFAVLTAGALAFTGCTGAEALDGRAGGSSADAPAIIMTVTGDATFDDRLTGRATCLVDDHSAGAVRQGNVRGASEAGGDSLLIAFVNMRPGTRELVGGRWESNRPDATRLAIITTVGGTKYQWARGGKATVTIRDRLGKSGTVSATGFARFEAFRDVPANLSVTVSWKCD